MIDERLGFLSNNKNPRLAIIPPKAPTLQRILENNGYQVSTIFYKAYIAYYLWHLVKLIMLIFSLSLQVVTQDLAYDKGGGFIRCLTLFANVDTAFDQTGASKNQALYRQYAKNIKNALTSSELEALHWTTEIHEMTEELYGLQYDYEVTYGATNKSRP